MHRRLNRKRKAFTLMELLLAMSILIIMGGLATFAFLNMGQNAKMDAMLAQIRTYEGACIAYKLKHNRFPRSLDDLYQPPSGLSERQWGGPFLNEPVEMDVWGNPYTYTADEARNKVFISSAGPDGQSNTVDDIPDPQDPNA